VNGAVSAEGLSDDVEKHATGAKIVGVEAGVVDRDIHSRDEPTLEQQTHNIDKQ